LTEGEVLRIGASNKDKKIIDAVIDHLDWTPARKKNGAKAYAATIINFSKKGYTTQMIADKIDQMEMDAIYSDLMSESPELYGNCGMLAVALLEEGIRRGKKVEVVFLSDADDPLEEEDYDLYHVAIYYNGSYYDDRGEIYREQLGDFISMKEGEDYNLDSYIVENKYGLDFILNKVELLTNWSRTCKEYKQRAVKFWDEVEK
jgi:hypothetical protein